MAQVNRLHINYSPNFPAAAIQAVERAKLTWQQAINFTQDVRIQAFWGVGLPGLVAMCIPNGFENFPNAPVPNTWYTSALADHIAGFDLLPPFPDMAIYFNSGPGWFNTNAGFCPPGQYDLESIALHEIGHGLGFLGLFWVANVVGQQLGSYGSPAILGGIPGNVIVPFPLPLLNGNPSVMGLLVRDPNGPLVGTYPNNSPQLAAALQSGNLVVNVQGVPRAIYAPAVFQPFSSGDHFSANSLMIPVIGTGVQIHAVDLDTLDVLKQIGW